MSKSIDCTSECKYKFKCNFEFIGLLKSPSKNKNMDTYVCEYEHKRECWGYECMSLRDSVIEKMNLSNNLDVRMSVSTWAEMWEWIKCERQSERNYRV